MGCVVEEWRDIPGQEGHYQVSSLGRLRSLDRSVRHAKGGLRKIKGRLLKPGLARTGHLLTPLGRRTHGQLVHRLVAVAFIGPCPDGQEVRHLNGDPADNRVENLAYGTRRRNNMDVVLHGRRALTPPQIRAIREMYPTRKYGDLTRLAGQFGVSLSTVHAAAVGRLYPGVV